MKTRTQFIAYIADTLEARSNFLNVYQREVEDYLEDYHGTEAGEAMKDERERWIAILNDLGLPVPVDLQVE